MGTQHLTRSSVRSRYRCFDQRGWWESVRLWSFLGAVLALEAARLLPTKITKLALYEPPFIIDDSRPPAPEDFAAHLTELVAAGRRGEAVEYFMTNVGSPAEMVAQMRQSPMWPGLEELAHTLAYDVTIIGDTESGDPLSLRKWAGVTVPTLVMDGTVFFGCEESHVFMRHGAQELANILPDAQHRTLEGQDHGPADEVLVPALQGFFFSFYLLLVYVMLKSCSHFVPSEDFSQWAVIVLPLLLTLPS